MPVSRRVQRPPMVLIASEEEWPALSLESVLGPAGYAVVRANTPRQIIDLASTARPDVVILDHSLGDAESMDLCRRLRDHPMVSEATPIILTTSGHVGRAQRVAGHAAGAWEVMGQPLDPELLLLKIQNFTLAKRDVDAVRDDSLLDHLTGLYSFRGLVRRAREIGAEAARRHDPLACIVMAPEPLLGAEEINDGLAARALEHASGILRSTSRASDIPGRLGQMELAVIAPATEEQGARRLAERLRDALESSPVEAGGRLRSFSFRTGVCAVPNFAEASLDPVELLLRASSAARQVRYTPSAGIAAFGDTTPATAE